MLRWATAEALRSELVETSVLRMRSCLMMALMVSLTLTESSGEALALSSVVSPTAGSS